MENIGIQACSLHTCRSWASGKTQHNVRLSGGTNQIRNLRGDVLARIGSKSENVSSDSLLLTQLARYVYNAISLQSDVRVFGHFNLLLRGRAIEQTKIMRSQRKINSTWKKCRNNKRSPRKIRLNIFAIFNVVQFMNVQQFVCNNKTHPKTVVGLAMNCLFASAKLSTYFMKHDPKHLSFWNEFSSGSGLITRIYAFYSNRFPSSYKNLENCRNKYNIQSNISLARADTLSPCYLATEALRNAYLSEVTRVKEDYSTERIPLKLRSDFRQDK